MSKKRDFKQARKSTRKLHEATIDSTREAATGKREKRSTAEADKFIKSKLKKLFPDLATQEFFENLGRASEQGPELVYRLSMTQATLCATALNEFLKTADPTTALSEIRAMTTIINRLLQSSLQSAKLDFEFNLAAHPDRITVEWNPWPEIEAPASSEEIH
jgi:hypothetical protein